MSLFTILYTYTTYTYIVFFIHSYFFIDFRWEVVYSFEWKNWTAKKAYLNFKNLTLGGGCTIKLLFRDMWFAVCAWWGISLWKLCCGVVDESEGDSMNRSKVAWIPRIFWRFSFSERESLSLKSSISLCCCDVICDDVIIRHGSTGVTGDFHVTRKFLRKFPVNFADNNPRKNSPRCDFLDKNSKKW